MLSEATTKAWEDWIEVAQARCHLHFELAGNSIESHVKIGRQAGRNCANRVTIDVQGAPAVVIEIGSSVGFNCLGLAERFPAATVIGIEPDGEACAAASAMAIDFGLHNASFVQGCGEFLPFCDDSVDWIVCHTVIEHVRDVDACISEMARVLRPGGVIHLEAPNYIWPWEPHLGIVIFPLSPKPVMRLLARLQGVGPNIPYIDHLKLVHPGWLERCFESEGLNWHSRVEGKFRSAARGESAQIVAYGRIARIFGFLESLNLANPVIRLLMRLRVYPSLLYTASKPRVGNYGCRAENASESL